MAVETGKTRLLKVGRMRRFACRGRRAAGVGREGQGALLSVAAVSWMISRREVVPKVMRTMVVARKAIRTMALGREVGKMVAAVPRVVGSGGKETTFAAFALDVMAAPSGEAARH